jgi:two-component system LytT family response regulator
MTLIGRSFTAVYRTTAPRLEANSAAEASGVATHQGAALGAVSSAPWAASGYLDRLVVRQGSHAVIVEVADILWLEAFGNYVRLHTSEQALTVRGTLASFEKQLDPREFVRVHRSAIVNRKAVQGVQPRRTGDFTLVLASGDQLTLSRNFRNLVPELRRMAS